MNAYIENTIVSRTNHDKGGVKASSGAARAFLAAAEADDNLTMKLSEADGEMTRILAIAAEAGYVCTSRELLAAYEDFARAAANASIQDFGYPFIYLGLRAPSDLSHAMVYLTLRSS